MECNHHGVGETWVPSPAPPTKLKPTLRGMGLPPSPPVQTSNKEVPQEGDSITREVQAILGLGSSCRLSVSYLKCLGQGMFQILFICLFTYMVYGFLPCMSVCVPIVCLMPMEVRKGCQIPWSWSHRWLWSIPKSKGKLVSLFMKQKNVYLKGVRWRQ